MPLTATVVMLGTSSESVSLVGIAAPSRRSFSSPLDLQHGPQLL